MADTLHAEQFVPRPRDEVFAFFSDAANLELITPPWLQFRIESSPAMREGALIDYRLKVRGIPLRWQSRIARWEPPHRFVDEQTRGPYRRWRHEHRFVEAPGGTTVIDHVEFQSPGGPLAPLITKLLVRRDVERIFDWRRRALTEIFSSQPAGRAAAGA